MQKSTVAVDTVRLYFTGVLLPAKITSAADGNAWLAQFM